MNEHGNGPDYGAPGVQVIERESTRTTGAVQRAAERTSCTTS